MKLQHTVLTALTLTLIPAVSHAAIVTPIGVTATTSGLDSDRGIEKTIDGSGLSGIGDILTQTHRIAGPSPDDDYYLSNSLAGGSDPAAAEIIEFDLGGATTIGAIHVWQYDRNNLTWNGRGISTFDLAFSTDGGATFATVLSGFSLTEELTEAPGVAGPVQSLTFASQSGVTDIRIQNINIFAANENRIGLSEVRFDTVPEPGSLALLGLGGLLVASRRRRASL